MKISLVADNPESWIHPYVLQLKSILTRKGHRVHLCGHPSQIQRGDLAFFLGCEKIVSPQVLARNKHNLVIHESALPKGRGWSPLTWQILEGKNKVSITLFEAQKSVDSGMIYGTDTMNFKGHELLDELRAVQGQKTIQLVMGFVRRYPRIKGRVQTGKPTFYKRRLAKDSEVNPNKSIKQIFNLLRVVDNTRYPAFFKLRGQHYVLKIEKQDN